MAENTRLIRLRGVRVHNLKGVDLDLPLGRLIAFTGVSGSGKSSLAFDTIYAEGQRRYLETFSAYSRQFLERLDRPDADSIEGVPPAIAIAQDRAGGRRGGRGTLSAATEIHDHLSLLYAKLGVVVCPSCDHEVVPASSRSIAEWVEALAAGTNYLIAFPFEVSPSADRAEVATALRQDGFTRVVVDGEVVRLDAEPTRLSSAAAIDVIVDRLRRGSETAQRRVDSIETALQKGGGRCRVIADGLPPRTFSRDWHCEHCGRALIAPEPRLFRPGDPLGACPTCEGAGVLLEVAGVLTKVPHGPKKRSRGKDPQIERTCPDCHGARLRPEALAVRVDGLDIATLSAKPVRDVSTFLDGYARSVGEDPVARRLLGQIQRRLAYLEEIGLGYLGLNRRLATLSSGESQRVALTSALGSALVNTLFVLDEPSVGLHEQDVDRLIRALRRLRDAGNTVIVVEHDLEIVRAADLVAEIGPGAGEAGGQLLYVGPPDGLGATPNSATADFLSGRRSVAVPDRRRARGASAIQIKGASGNNLKNIDVALPLGLLCVVTGVSGAGKTTLVEGTLYPALRALLGREPGPAQPLREISIEGQIDDVILIDQTPIGRSARSNPATYLKVFDEIRKAFAATHEAKIRDYRPSRFSFNVEGGRCNTCEGNGYLTVDMQFLPDVMIRCPDCRGARFRPETLEITYRGKNIAEVLAMSAREAFLFFRHRPKIQYSLRPMLDVGLDYLRLGQPASTLSGGEAQRLKLASKLSSRPGTIASVKTLFLLDEPTRGFHPSDTLRLLDVFQSLLALGHSLVVIEHGPEVLASADWIIELGPGPGAEGGKVIAEGTPEDVARRETPTGRVLNRVLAVRPAS
jgi:excinuclease ABC subunit A